MNSKRALENASWIIGSKVVQAVLSFIVTTLSARYLGPSGYGIINYAASIVAFVVPVMQLGLSSTLVQEVIDAPEREGKVLGTALVMCVTSGIACIIGIFSLVNIMHTGEADTIIVCSLYSICLLFQGLEMIQYWFQAKLLSKYTSLVMLAAYVITSAYKIILLITGRSIYWFAVAQSLDYFVIAVILLVIYKKLGKSRLSFSFVLGKQMFRKSRYYIVSSLMVTIFAQTDRIMLKMMIGEAAVGYYAAAVECAGITGFVFTAIITSARPIIIEKKKHQQAAFESAMTLLYSVIIYLALAQSIVITLFSKPIVGILYGSAYSPTISALRIIVWYTTFSYIGGARTIWILIEEKQKYLWIINLSGASANVLLNYFLIPVMGINGAATASLITQIIANVVMGHIIKPIRANNRLMYQALSPNVLMKSLKLVGSFKVKR